MSKVVTLLLSMCLFNHWVSPISLSTTIGICMWVLITCFPCLPKEIQHQQCLHHPIQYLLSTAAPTSIPTSSSATPTTSVPVCSAATPTTSVPVCYTATPTTSIPACSTAAPTCTNSITVCSIAAPTASTCVSSTAAPAALIPVLTPVSTSSSVDGTDVGCGITLWLFPWNVSRQPLMAEMAAMLAHLLHLALASFIISPIWQHLLLHNPLTGSGKQL